MIEKIDKPVQQPLELQLDHPPNWDDFFVGENNQLVNYLKDLQSEKIKIPEKGLFIYGEPCSGKTLLTQIFRYTFPKSNQKLKNQNQIGFLDLESISPSQSYLLESFEIDLNWKFIIIDHIHLSTEKGFDLFLFNLVNKCLDAHICPIYTSLKAPNQLLNMLPDLRSRLAWGEVYKLNKLPESGYQHAFERLAERYGLTLNPEVLQYLLSRVSRDLQSMISIVEILARASIESQRKITIPFVKSVLNI